MKRTVGAGRLPVRARRGIGRASALLLAGVLLLLFQSPPADAAGEGQQLALSRDVGPPGTAVEWVAIGFDGCKAFGDEEPEGGEVPERGQFEEAPLAPAAPAARVELVWDDEEVLATAEVEEGRATSILEIPASAEPGLHLVTARCAGVSSVAVSQFRVPEPRTEPRTPADPGQGSPVLVAVPSVVDASLDEAREALKARELKLGAVVGDTGGIVETQRPRAGKKVRRGTSVRVTTVAQPVPSVTDVVGKSSTEADTAPRGSSRLATALAAVILGLVAGTAALRRLKRQLDQRWVDRHDVRAEPATAPDPVVVVEMTDDTGAPTLTVRIEPHPDDSGAHVLEEMSRP